MLRRPGAKAHDWFAGVNRGNGVVRFSFLPMHAHPELLDELSPDVLKRKRGASLFAFTLGRRRGGRGAGGAAGARVRRLLAWRRSRCLIPIRSP